MSSDQLFSRRAAAKLSRLLNDLGYPTALLERATTLSETTKMPRETCFQVLSGEVPWTWYTLDRLCETFGKQPGFFLDLQDSSIPVAAVTVPSAEGGESTVWCPPRGLGRSLLNPDEQLRHVTRLVPRVGPDVVGLYVFKVVSVREGDLAETCQYILTNGNGIEVVTFEHRTKEAAIFSGCSDASIHRVLLPITGSPIGEIIGEVVGLIIVR